MGSGFTGTALVKKNNVIGCRVKKIVDTSESGRRPVRRAKIPLEYLQDCHIAHRKLYEYPKPEAFPNRMDLFQDKVVSCRNDTG